MLNLGHNAEAQTEGSCLCAKLASTEGYLISIWGLVELAMVKRGSLHEQMAILGKEFVIKL